MKPAKVTFYPEQEVADVLKAAPSKKVSERVNELILKGLALEKEQQMKRDYDRYNHELATSPSGKKSGKGISSTLRAAERLFTDDEGSSDEDLF